MRELRRFESYEVKDMPKKLFGLSDATRETLTDNVKAMAAAWDCSTSFIYQVLREEKADVYSPFHEFYCALLKAGISTAAFDNDMEFERERYARRLGRADLAVSMKDKLHRHNELLERYVGMLQDGLIDSAEAAELEQMLDREEDAIKLIRQALKLRKEEGIRVVRA